MALSAAAAREVMQVQTDARAAKAIAIADGFQRGQRWVSATPPGIQRALADFRHELVCAEDMLRAQVEHWSLLEQGCLAESLEPIYSLAEVAAKFGPRNNSGF